MNLLLLQCLDQVGGGSRASLRETMAALRNERPDWQFLLATRNEGPVTQFAADLGIPRLACRFSRYRKLWERPAFLQDCRKLAGELEGRGIEGVLSNEWTTAPHALAVAKKLKIPAMSYVRDFAAIDRGRKYLLHEMDRLLCVCESMRGELISVGYDPAKVRTVYNPVRRPEFGGPTDDQQRLISAAESVDKWLLYLGRISSRKNQIEAVRVLESLRDQSGERWGLLLAGDQDDDYSERVSRQAEELGLAGQVVKLGMVPQPGWVFEMCEASLLTSKSEGLARVLIESFLEGKPAFSMDLSGLEDIYAGSKSQFVSPQGKPDELAQRIIGLSLQAEVTARETGGVREFLLDRHSQAAHVEAFVEAVRVT